MSFKQKIIFYTNFNLEVDCVQAQFKKSENMVSKGLMTVPYK